MASITTAKQQLRGVMRKRLAQVPHDSVLAQSRAVFETLKSLDAYSEAKRISIFLSMPSGEIQTDAIVRHSLSEGKQVFVPYLHKSPPQTPGLPARVMDMVHLRSMQDYDGLKRDAWGIPSVDPATVEDRRRVLGVSDHHRSGGPVALDLVLVPGVAFDVDGDGAIRRLGHGKGFYDCFLNRYLAGQGGGHSLRMYGLALREQLLDAEAGEEVAMGAYDRKLHGVILGDGRVLESSDPRSINAWHPSRDLGNG